MTNQDSIVFRIDRTAPIELEKLTLGMMALGDEYGRFVKSNYPEVDNHETDLLVQKISEGSIVIEMFGAIQPILQGINNVLVFKQFVELVGGKFSVLSKKNGELEGATTRELHNLSNLADTIVGNDGGKTEILAYEYNARTKEREVRASVVWKAKPAETVKENIVEQIKKITKENPNRQKGVLMHLFQTNIGEASPDRASGEKGIIECISDNPKKLIYASNLAGQKIKDSWANDSISPYELGFIVDVDIQTVNGKIRAYRIMEVHEIFPLTEDD